MIRTYLLSMLLLMTASIHAQQNEYLVYAVRGPVSIAENKKEIPLKIGRILKDSAVIVVHKAGLVTIICNGVHVFTIKKESRVPLVVYTDSCLNGAQNFTTNYFRYVWNQMYARSPDNPNRALMHNAGSVSRNKPLDPRAAEVELSEILDTINYASGVLGLHWTVKNYQGDYSFELFDATTKQAVFTKKLSVPSIMMTELAKRMLAGNSYYWTVTLKGWGTTEPRWINFVPAATVKELVNDFSGYMLLPEDSATFAFRLGYLLESARYLADAYAYYQEAARADVPNGIYRTRFDEFKKELGMPVK